MDVRTVDKQRVGGMINLEISADIFFDDNTYLLDQRLDLKHSASAVVAGGIAWRRRFDVTFDRHQITVFQFIVA